MLSIELIRNRGRSGTSFRIRITRSPNFGSAGKSAPQAGQVNARQHDLVKALATSRFICSTTTPAGTERELPRP